MLGSLVANLCCPCADVVRRIGNRGSARSRCSLCSGVRHRRSRLGRDRLARSSNGRRGLRSGAHVVLGCRERLCRDCLDGLVQVQRAVLVQHRSYAEVSHRLLDLCRGTAIEQRAEFRFIGATVGHAGCGLRDRGVDRRVEWSLRRGRSTRRRHLSCHTRCLLLSGPSLSHEDERRVPARGHLHTGGQAGIYDGLRSSDVALPDERLCRVPVDPGRSRHAPEHVPPDGFTRRLQRIHPQCGGPHSRESRGSEHVAGEEAVRNVRRGDTCRALCAGQFRATPDVVDGSRRDGCCANHQRDLEFSGESCLLSGLEPCACCADRAHEGRQRLGAATEEIRSDAGALEQCAADDVLRRESPIEASADDAPCGVVAKDACSEVSCLWPEVNRVVHLPDRHVAAVRVHRDPGTLCQCRAGGDADVANRGQGSGKSADRVAAHSATTPREVCRVRRELRVGDLPRFDAAHEVAQVVRACEVRHIKLGTRHDATRSSVTVPLLRVILIERGGEVVAHVAGRVVLCFEVLSLLLLERGVVLHLLHAALRVEALDTGEDVRVGESLWPRTHDAVKSDDRAVRIEHVALRFEVCADLRRHHLPEAERPRAHLLCLVRSGLRREG